MIIEDPIGIILRDKRGRDKKVWQKFDPEFLGSMADAILRNDRVFVIDGKIHNRETGKALTVNQALGFLPPTARENAKIAIKSKDPKFASNHLATILNGDNSFIFENKLFSKQGVEINPALMISAQMTKKSQVLIKPTRYKGFDSTYLVARGNALMNNDPHFKVANQVYDAESGRNLSSPFRSLAKKQDVFIEKQRRVQYQNLSDKETIINFNRDKVKETNVCQYYAIVDKQQAKVSVHKLSGEVVFSKEVLVGVNSSDVKTQWIKFTEDDRFSNYTTGAGVFKVGPPKAGIKYEKNYDNNILQIEDQVAFAIHQIPNTLKGRYKNFGTGNALDRRITGGCVNLKKDDFIKLTSWIKPSCQIYVLPEEESNRFLVKDGKLEFLPLKPLASAKNYNFTADKSKPQPIKIIINNPIGKTDVSVAFAKSLESEKPKLMKILNLNNDEYNDLASLAFGILGNETKFGLSPKFWIKEQNQNKVIVAKFARDLWEHKGNLLILKSPVTSNPLNTSRGLTQIKNLPEGEWRKAYPNINKETLTNPQHAAIATMSYLADAMGALKSISEENKSDSRKVRITRETMVEFLAYIYQGRKSALESNGVPTKPSETAVDPATPAFNQYVQKLKRNLSYIEISQKIE